jgi:hypothetical protein
LRKQLAGLRALEQDRLAVPAGATASDSNQDVDMAPATPAPSTTGATTEAGESGVTVGDSTSALNKNAEAMSRMMQLCDTIE